MYFLCYGTKINDTMAQFLCENQCTFLCAAQLSYATKKITKAQQNPCQVSGVIKIYVNLLLDEIWWGAKHVMAKYSLKPLL